MEHLPEGDLEDGLQNYHLVTYDNIDEDKFYFVIIGHDDYLGKVVLKDDYIINIDFTMKHYHINDGWRYHIGKLTAEKDQVVQGAIQFYEYVDNQNGNNHANSNSNTSMNMSGGGVVANINQRLNKPSYILPAGTVAYRTTPPFFRKASRANRSTRKSKKQRRVTRKAKRAHKAHKTRR